MNPNSNYKRKLKEFLNTHKAIIIIALFALIIRVIFFIAVQPWNEQILQNKILVKDSADYHKLALSILNTRSFSSWNPVRTPGYPIFISMIYFIFGIKPWVVSLIQVLLNIISLIMVYVGAKMIFNKQVAIISAVLFAIDPHTILHSIIPATETLFVLIFLVSILILIYGLRCKKIIFFLISGFLLGLATLVRPIAQFFPIVVIGLILSYPRIKFVFRLKMIISFSLIFLLIIAPWLYRNYSEYNHLSLCCIKGLMFLHIVSVTEAGKTGKSVDQMYAEFRKKAEEQGANETNNPFDYYQILTRIEKNYIIANWKLYIPMHLKGMANMFLSLYTSQICWLLGLESNRLPWEVFQSPSMLKTVRGFFKSKSNHEIMIGMFIGIFLLINYLAFFFGSISMICEKRYMDLIIISSVIMYFTVLTGVAGLAQYKLPIIPFYNIVSAQGLFKILKFSKNRKQHSI